MWLPCVNVMPDREGGFPISTLPLASPSLVLYHRNTGSSGWPEAGPGLPVYQDQAVRPATHPRLRLRRAGRAGAGRGGARIATR